MYTCEYDCTFSACDVQLRISRLFQSQATGGVMADGFI